MAYTPKEIEDFIRAANWDLGSGKYKSMDVIPDYAKAVIICQEQAEQIKAKDKAYNELEQNVIGLIKDIMRIMHISKEEMKQAFNNNLIEQALK
jgi:hypothetical protein